MNKKIKKKKKKIVAKTKKKKKPSSCHKFLQNDGLTNDDRYEIGMASLEGDPDFKKSK